MEHPENFYHTGNLHTAVVLVATGHAFPWVEPNGNHVKFRFADPDGQVAWDAMTLIAQDAPVGCRAIFEAWDLIRDAMNEALGKPTRKRQ